MGYKLIAPNNRSWAEISGFFTPKKNQQRQLLGCPGTEVRINCHSMGHNLLSIKN